MKIAFQTTSVHPDWLIGCFVSIDFIFLRKYVNNLFSRKHSEFVYLIYQIFYVFFSDNLFWVGAADIIAVLDTSDMLSGNTYNHIVYRSEEHTSELQSRPHLVCR